MSHRFRPGDTVTITLTATIAPAHGRTYEAANMAIASTDLGGIVVRLAAVGLLTEPEPDTTVVDRNGDQWRRYGTDPGGRHWRCQTPVDGWYARESWATVTDRFGPIQREQTNRPRAIADGSPG